MTKKQKIYLLIIIVLLITISTLIFININKKQNNKEENLFITYTNYIEENYDDYLEYYKNNRNIEIKDIIDFINYCKENSISIDKIDKHVINLYTLDNFNLNNLDRYINYIDTTNDTDFNKIIEIVNNNLDGIIINYDEVTQNFILELIKQKYYKVDNLERYINYYNENHSLDYENIVINVNSNLDYAFYDEYEITDTSKDTLMIVNKHYKLDESYIPDNLVVIDGEHGYWNKLRADVYEEFKKMYEAAKKDNVKLFIASPYRSYSEQATLYNYYVNTDGVKNADTYSARPGFSEHHTGLAMDLIPEYGLDLDTFENSDGFNWMQSNAYKYGFILRYPKDKEYITGYIYEPWHYRYVGIEAAKIIKEENITFEEYYEYYIDK